MSLVGKLLGILPVLAVVMLLVATFGNAGTASAGEPYTRALTTTLTDGTVVTVEASTDAIPEGTTLEAKAIDNDAITEAVTAAAKADGTELTSVKAIDITLRDAAGNELEPSAAVKVTLSELGMNETGLSVYHVTAPDGNEAQATNADDLNVEKVESSTTDANEQVFQAESFSIYAIGETARLKVNFHQIDGAVKTIYVTKKDLENDKVNDIVYDPGCGTLTGKQVFKGWTTTENWALDEKGNVPEGKDIEGVRATVTTKLNSLTADDTLDFYPIVVKTFKVTYRDANGVAVHTDEVTVKDRDVPYTVNYAYTSDAAEFRFDGWDTSSKAETAVYKNPYTDEEGTEHKDTITFTSSSTTDVDLYAVVTPGIWITFDGHETGASYTAPVFVQYGQSVNDATAPNKIADPTCPGWTFAGWFEDDLNNKAFDFEAKIPTGTKNMTLHARWNKNTTADYTVNIWLQNATDASKYDFYQAYTVENATVDQGAIENGVKVVNTPGNDNSYVVLYATVGNDDTAIAIQPGYNADTMSDIKLPFHLKSYTDVTVNPDGKTVMNVYYDRTVYTLTFASGYQQVWRPISTAADPSSVPGVTKETTGFWPFTRTTYYYTDANGDMHELQDRGGWYQYNWGYYENVPSNAKTIKALYGQNIADQFPIPGYKDASWTAQNSKYFSSSKQLSILSVMPAEDTTFQSYIYKGDSSYPFKFYFQTLPGVSGNESHAGMTFSGGEKYTIKSDGLSATKNEDWIDFEGFDRYDSTPSFDNGDSVRLTSGTGISFYYTRKSYQIVYTDGATYKAPGTSVADRIAELEHVQISDPASVLYEQNTSAYSKAPGSPEAPTKDGYVFAGWYDDTACTQPHDFDAQMPAHNVTVYAKWIKTQYQVTIHDGSASGNEYAGGYHNPSYVGYDGTVEEPQVNRGPEWEFVGWYVDEACTQPFTFGYHLNKTTEPTLGIDAETPSPDNYVAGKMDLYAKWRHVLVGADGMTVVYDALDGNKVKGAQTHTDQQKYEEGATASATSAATYKDDTQKFQYWDLQRWDSATNQYVSTDTKVYPGDTFDVKYEYARQTANDDNTEDHPSYTYTVMLKAVYADSTPEKTTVIFDANKGTFGTGKGDKDTKSYDVNTEITIPGEPSREGYTFLGWSGTQKDFWTQEDFDAATDKLDSSKTYAADNLEGLAWQAKDGTNVLYACWKKKPVTLTIQKELVGAQADLTKGYTFTVTKDGGGSFTTSALYDRKGESDAGDQVILGGAEKTRLELLWGDKVTITETDNTGYTTSYSVTVGNKDAVNGDGKATGQITLDADSTTAIFTNTKVQTPVTAVNTADAPKILGVLAIAGLAIAGGFALVQRNTLQAASAGAHSAGRHATKRTDSNGNGRHMRGNGRRW